ncbi:MAG: metallophosphoesterase [Candidatus Margulisiibacteriota bacterium]
MVNQEPPRILLIVSDLHLSSGWDENTKRLSLNEDFFFDQSFQRFLNFYIAKGSREKRRIDLIIAGDFVDLLQVTDKVENEKGIALKKLDGEDITQTELDYGLGTSPRKSCWKLKKVIKGHTVFFQELVKFLLADNRVIILPGNHDIEFALPEVQKCLREELLGFLPEEEAGGPAWEAEPERRLDKEEAQILMSRNLCFHPWFYYEPGLLYVEHGHQYDCLNSFDYFLHPLTPAEATEKFIYLPVGSFFVRYLFNKLENIFPFADNMKPVTNFIKHTLFRWKNLQMWFHIGPYFRFFNKTLREKTEPIKPQWRLEMGKRQQEYLQQIASDSDISLKDLQALKDHWALTALHHWSKLRLLGTFLMGESEKDVYYQAAKRIKDTLGVRYVVFGHTHEADLRPLGKKDDNQGWSQEYINSGTWTRVFTEDFTELLLKDENEFVFVMIDSLTKKMELLRWKDDLNQGERVRLFQSHQAQPKSKNKQ